MNLLQRLKLAWTILKGGVNMLGIFVALITYKQMTINQVPPHLQNDVLTALNVLGLDGYGNPLEN